MRSDRIRPTVTPRSPGAQRRLSAVSAAQAPQSKRVSGHSGAFGYTPDGAFLKSNDASLTGYVLDSQAKQLEIVGIIFARCQFRGLKIGVRVCKDGKVMIPGG